MISFREILLEDAEKLLQWRLQPRIAEWMLTAVENDTCKQRAWLTKKREDSGGYHWIVQIKSIDVGYVKMENYDAPKRSAEVGFYIGEERYTATAVGVLHAFYAALFSHFELDNILAGIFEGNIIMKYTNFLDMKGIFRGKSSSLKALPKKSWFLMCSAGRFFNTNIHAKTYPTSRWRCGMDADSRLEESSSYIIHIPTRISNALSCHNPCAGRVQAFAT